MKIKGKNVAQARVPICFAAFEFSFHLLCVLLWSMLPGNVKR